MKEPMGSPIALTKKCGSTKCCYDYRKLTQVTKRDVYLIPRLDDALKRLGKASFSTSLDMEDLLYLGNVFERFSEYSIVINQANMFLLRQKINTLATL